MNPIVLDLFFSLMKDACVIIVLAYLLLRCKSFSEVIHRNITLENQIFFILVFGIFSIYGTLNGIRVMGAPANIRDLGPMIAGLLAGPVAGIGAGLIGGIHRYFAGGITATSCAVATVLAGILGGGVHKLLKGKLPGIVSASLLMAAMEAVHMGIVLLLAKPSSTAFSIVQQVGVPMIITNAAGMGIFIFIVINRINEQTNEAEKRVMEGELAAAHEIQMSILPKIFPAFPERKEFDLHAILEPAREVGGDLYDFYPLDENRLFFVIGDVSGKGVPASLFMAITMTLFKVNAEGCVSPAEVMTRVNNQLSRDNEASMFVTTVCGILDVPTGELALSNGGHNPPLILGAEGLRVIAGTPSMVVGAMEDIPYPLLTETLKPGEVLVLFTDGVTEAMNGVDEAYGDDRLADELLKVVHQPAADITQTILDDIRRFTGDTPQSDDITLLALRYSGSTGEQH
ncbi:SpoIIE family protein phosphatase [Desulfoluna sp.]|uniref:PP2C family protein-serine/threonine phosphatase n=1 Tax=Desulfoluna sp. TaxID=2045199 RepID=UPI00262AB70C|nr:SpoIIE family protein phosphatase [Desulfoluna sp.]